MQQVYLTRRNLMTLLNKLDHKDESECCIVKRDTTHAKYPCSDVTYVHVVEDDEYYTDREPGEVKVFS